MTALSDCDTLMDRRDLWFLLHRLHPRKRLQFLDWCCRAASRPHSPCPTPVPEMLTYGNDALRCDRGDDRFTAMIYVDLVAISNQYGLDLGKTMIALERFVKTGDLPEIPGRKRKKVR